jgi:hypothetical protein
MRRLLQWFGALALLFVSIAPAYAHKPSDSYLSLVVKGRHVEGQWDIALRDLDFAIGLDTDGNGELTWDEVRGHHPAIAAYALKHLALASTDGACPLAAGAQLLDNHTDGAYTVLRFSADCPGADGLSTLRVKYTLFAELDPQHRGLLRVARDGTTSTAILGPDQPDQTLSLAAPDRLAQFGAYVRNGIWHIWIGFDHILFLLSLLLPAVLATPTSRPSDSFKASFIDVLKVVTAFTLAHSITLTLAALSVISLPSRWVESAIAASVIAAALNNVFPLFRGKRPLAAFAFGLIHGFGFASVLTDLGLPQGALIASLFGFNLGVEIGQLSIVAVFLPLAFMLRHTWFYRRLLTWGSAAIVVVASIWLIERVADIKVLGF